MRTKHQEMSGLVIAASLAIGLGAIAIPTAAQAQHTIVQLENRTVRDEADRLLDLGQQQVKAGKPREAIKTWLYAIGYYRRVNDPAAISYTLAKVADTYEKMGAQNAAQTTMHRHIDYANMLQDRGGVTRSNNNLASLALNKRDLDRATTFANRALQMAEADEQSLDRAIALNSKGLIASIQGNQLQALRLYYQSIVERPLRDALGDGYTYINSGDAWLAKDNYKRALKDYGMALTIARQYGNYQLMATASDRLIHAYLEVPNFYRIEELLQNRSSLALIMGDRETAANIQRYLGDLYLSFGDLAKARTAYQESYNFAAMLEDRYSLPLREAYFKLQALEKLQ